MRPMLALLFVVLAADPPIDKIDRARVVGPPVLDKTAKEGVYVWLEDGWYHVAVQTDLPFGTKKKRTKTFTLSFASTKPITAKLGSFKRTGGSDGDLDLRVVVGPEPEIAKFQTEGDISVSRASTGRARAQIFVGPLAKEAAPSVKIGRF